MAEVDVATARGEELVGFCAICGVEFDAKALTNRFISLLLIFIYGLSLISIFLITLPI